MTEKTEIAILRAQTGGLGRLEEIVVVGCWLFVANSNQSRSQHSFEHLTFILFINLSYLPAIVSFAADFSWRGYTVPFSPQSGFGFSYPAVSYLVSF